MTELPKSPGRHRRRRDRPGDGLLLSTRRTARSRWWRCWIRSAAPSIRRSPSCCRSVYEKKGVEFRLGCQGRSLSTTAKWSYEKDGKSEKVAGGQGPGLSIGRRAASPQALAWRTSAWRHGARRRSSLTSAMPHQHPRRLRGGRLQRQIHARPHSLSRGGGLRQQHRRQAGRDALPARFRR